MKFDRISSHNDLLYIIFFFNDTATTEIYTLSLHDALPICQSTRCPDSEETAALSASARVCVAMRRGRPGDRKSTRLNSSHSQISYAVFCLKKKKRNYKSRLDLTHYNKPPITESYSSIPPRS